MDAEMIDALADYGRTIKQNGWQAGESLIEKYSSRFEDFKKWAYALAIMLRAEEILDENLM